MLYEVADNIATITFNRLDSKIRPGTLARFTELLIEADVDEEVRAIVITGTGKFFARVLICVAATSQTAWQIARVAYHPR